MTSSPTEAPSHRRKLRAAMATLSLVAGISAATTGAADAATPQCDVGGPCISVFSSALGTYAQPRFVEAVLGDGAARVGQPVGLKPASPLDSSEDIRPVLGSVSYFHGLGQVSDAANARYGNLDAVKQRYSPFGIDTDLCVGLDRAASEKQGLTLQRCDAPTTVWIVNAFPRTEEQYFPIVNATTTDFERPFAMHLPRDAVAAGKPIQMQVRRLQFMTDEATGEMTLPASQLWGAWFGRLP